jgi:hypothetical protein
MYVGKWNEVRTFKNHTKATKITFRFNCFLSAIISFKLHSMSSEQLQLVRFIKKVKEDSIIS